MEISDVKEILLSPTGRAVVLLIRAFLASLCVCGGIRLFGIKDDLSSFTFRRIVGLFLLIIGARLLVDVVFFFNIA